MTLRVQVYQVCNCNYGRPRIGTCEASRFDSNSNRPPDSIRFESDGPIRKFSNRIGCACPLLVVSLVKRLTALTGTAYRLAVSTSASYAGSLMCLRIVMTNEEYVVPNPHISFDSLVITDFNN